MGVTATQLRKDLFQTLDRAAQGETVEIDYKGATILLKPASTSKLARAVRRPTILVNPDELVGSDGALQDELEGKWDREASQLSTIPL
ncbi:MAG: hypothetical protein JWN34_4444 [Bryobacterales bacterium]|jgi:hypothetical protein|nr:hypothetical protein [Bryobacterales bacterium]